MNEKASQQNLLKYFLYIGGAYTLVFAYVYTSVVHNTFLGLEHILAFFLVVASYLAAQITKNYNLGVMLILLDGTMVVLSLLATGGWGSTGYLWAFVYLPYASLLTTKRQAWFWICLLFVGSLAVVGLGALGLYTLPYSNVALFNYFFGYLIFSFCVMVFKTRAEKNETALRIRRVEDEALISSISDGIVVRDKELRIIKTNPAFVSLLGYSELEIIGKDAIETLKITDINGKALKPKDLLSSKAAASHKQAVGAYKAIKKDGTPVILDVIAAPYVVDGQLTGTVTVFRDISQQIAIDKAKTEFVSLAAHQLRTPLSSMNWYLEMILNKDTGKLNRKQHDYLAEVVMSTHRMVDLVNSLLNVSQVDLGAFSTNPVPLDLRLITETMLKNHKEQIQQKLLEVKAEFSGDIHSYIIDPHFAEIIVQNLISNAVKYTPKKGVIHIKIVLNNEKLTMTVADTGYGIPKDQTQKVFSKLFRADNVIIKDTEGTGLGLYLVKAIVEDIGGDISFTSVVNKGTTFIVELPATGMKHVKRARKRGVASRLVK